MPLVSTLPCQLVQHQSVTDSQFDSHQFVSHCMGPQLGRVVEYMLKLGG